MKTAVDWLSFRTKSNPFETMEAMRPMFGSASDLVQFVPGNKGRDGWERGGDIMMVDIRLGWMDYGGESQRGWVRVQLTGEGCGWVQDWYAAEKLQDTLEGADIKRLDIALTTFNGEVSDAMVAQAYAEGRFTTWGRPPRMKSIVSSDPRAGRTRYIGTRTGADKFLRCYEKGWEMLTHVPETMRSQVNAIDGHDLATWYRVELELKAVAKYIPWNVLTDQRDATFAGAYPFCADLLPGVPEFKLQVLPDFKPRAALAGQVEHCRVAYGGALRIAVEVYGRDKLLDMILGDKPSRALIDLGVLTVDHV